VEDWDVEVPPTPERRAEFMIRGYKRAADELVESAVADPAIKPVLVYPIIYCYRQFIELSLKNQLSKFGSTAALSSNRIMRSHDLKKLLSNYLKLDSDRVTNALTQREVGYLIGLIKDLHKIDPQSFTFRYPDGRDNLSEFMSTNKVDLLNIREVMGAIATLLIFSEEEFERIFT
jgi:hypothetical protein